MILVQSDLISRKFDFCQTPAIYSLIHFKNEFDQFCVVDFESFILGSMNMFLSSKKLFLAPSWVTWQKEQMAPALSGIKDSWGLWSTIGLPAQVNLLRSHLQNRRLISEKNVMKVIYSVMLINKINHHILLLTFLWNFKGLVKSPKSE